MSNLNLSHPAAATPADIVYIGLNKKVAALHRETGRIVWEWKAPKGNGFVSLLLEADALIVSVSGYTYNLDPETGSQRWMNEMKGYGWGVATLTSLNAVINSSVQAAANQAQAQQQAAASTGAAGGAA